MVLTEKPTQSIIDISDGFFVLFAFTRGNRKSGRILGMNAGRRFESCLECLLRQ
jgi:hypothetical protein